MFLWYSKLTVVRLEFISHYFGTSINNNKHLTSAFVLLQDRYLCQLEGVDINPFIVWMSILILCLQNQKECKAARQMFLNEMASAQLRFHDSANESGTELSDERVPASPFATRAWSFLA
jgi:hypothetical protein